MLLCKVFFQGSLSAEKNHPFPISRAAYKTQNLFDEHLCSILIVNCCQESRLTGTWSLACLLPSSSDDFSCLSLSLHFFLTPLCIFFHLCFFSLYPGPLNQKMHILYCLLSRSSAVLRAVKRQEWSGLPASCCITQPVVWAAWFLAWVACSMGSKREREHTSRNSALFFLLSGWTHWQWEWFTWW